MISATHTTTVIKGLRFLLEKEFTQLLRNKFLTRIALVLPFIALTLFPMVVNFDIRDIKLAVVDHDHSSYSARLIGKMTASGYFRLTSVRNSYSEALTDVEQDVADVVLEIPSRFEENLAGRQEAGLMISANSVNGIKGGLSSAYLMSVVNNFSNELRDEWFPTSQRLRTPSAEVVPVYRYNPLLKYKFMMIPAIMMMMLAMIVGFLPALNIVGEKEKGTIEQMNVTPVNRFTIILSKLIPYWVLGFAVLTICFLVAWMFYGMVSVGNYGILYLFAAVFTLSFSGLGLVISNYASTIQQGMFLMFFFIITFIFLSGLYTPVSSMPDWTQTLSRISPLRYMVEVLRSIFLKGSGFADLQTHFLALCGFAVFFNAWAVFSYRKHS